MDIYKELTKDHDEVKEMLAKLVKNPQDMETFKKLEIEVSVHAIAEEKTFYTPLKKKLNSLAILIEGGYQEHEETLHLFDLFHKEDLSLEEKKRVILFLKRSLEDHIEKEEAEMYDLAKENFSAAEAKDMADKFNQEKDKIKENMPNDEVCSLEDEAA